MLDKSANLISNFSFFILTFFFISFTFIIKFLFQTYAY